MHSTELLFLTTQVLMRLFLVSLDRFNQLVVTADCYNLSVMRSMWPPHLNFALNNRQSKPAFWLYT